MTVRKKSNKTEKVFIGLAALALCPFCQVNWMPCMNMKSCQDCARERNICEWTGEEKDIIKHNVKVRRNSTKK